MSEEIKNLNNESEQAPVEKTEAKKPLDKKTIAIIAAAAAVVVLVLVLVLTLGGKKDYTLGLGVSFGDFTSAQVNATVATVVLDKDGKIVECRIDAIQNKYAVDGTTVKFNVLDTKMELGDKYGMAGKVDNNKDGVMLEWYEQVKAFEKYVVGMTADEVKAIETQLVNNHHIAKDEALLSAGCTIQISDFIAAVVKACNDEYAVSFKSNGKFTLGVAANNSDNGSSVDATTGVVSVKLNSDIAATVVDSNGKILASLNDAIQPVVIYTPAVKDAEGNVLVPEVITETSVGKGNGILKTKRELKEDYKMAAFGAPNVEGGTVKEWYVQSAAFSAYIVGMTADEVKGLETKTVNNHLISTDEALLSAGCTMQITGIMDVVAESMEYAR